jgi:endonuclease/exonuclease/phosphatase family metal-dependent hydrolase
LNFTSHSFGPAGSENFGNAILCRYNTTFNNTLIPLPKRETRGCLNANITYNGCDISTFLDILILIWLFHYVHNLGISIQIYLIHLHHIDEETRIQQLSEVLNIVNNTKKEDSYHIIAGDFNSLTREDYSDEYYNEKIYQVIKTISIKEWNYTNKMNV